MSNENVFAVAVFVGLLAMTVVVMVLVSRADAAVPTSWRKHVGFSAVIVGLIVGTSFALGALVGAF
jgi:hypothetical protein